MGYDRAGPPGTKPAGAAMPGTTALQQLILELFPGITDGGVYDPRDVGKNPIAPDGSGAKRRLSLHAEGRAFDAMVSASTNQALGDRLAAWAIEHHDALHIQELIWNRRIWTQPARRWEPYTGLSDHTDHVHVGQDRAGSRDADVVERWKAGAGGGGVAPGPKRGAEQSLAELLAGIDAHFSAMRYPGDPVVLGMQGVHVDAIQWKLNKLAGCSFPCDGSFSADVERAVRDFQTFCKVPGDVLGKVGRSTWTALQLSP
jgi:hypothetical protein